MEHPVKNMKYAENELEYPGKRNDLFRCVKTHGYFKTSSRYIDFSTESLMSVLLNYFISGKASVKCFHPITSRISSTGFSVPRRTAIFLFLSLLWARALTDPLPRIPPYQDVEAALESTRCAVRDEIVDIRKEHPTLPPNSLLMPSCVLLRRCSGCCQSDRHLCMPTSIYSTKIEVSLQLMSPKRFNYITLNFTHHADCSCMSPLHPTCVPRVCAENEAWNKDFCRCEGRCQPRECGHRQRWNPQTCRCQCEPCHPNRLIHSRFLQDEVTCICACRHSMGIRPRCRKRRRFSFSQCACVNPRGLPGWPGNRGTR